MTKIIIDIKNCKSCPFFKTANPYSTDGFDHMEDWICSKVEPNVKIAGAVEWHDENKIEVPNWCPILAENK